MERPIQTTGGRISCLSYCLLSPLATAEDFLIGSLYVTSLWQNRQQRPPAVAT